MRNDRKIIAEQKRRVLAEHIKAHMHRLIKPVMNCERSRLRLKMEGRYIVPECEED